MALAIPPADAAGRGDRGFLESFDRMAIHGYVDNFSILRSDTFKTDYHVASSRYRASVQLAGPLYMMQDYFDRFEYFIELRPQYESIYDIDDKFGNGRKGEGKRFVSGRSGYPKPGNQGFLRAFGLNPGHYAGFWPKEEGAGASVEFLHALVPGSKYGVQGRDRDSRSRGYYGLDASQNDLRYGMTRETNMDLYYPVREAYFDFFWKGLGGRNWLRVGKQQHVWGKADFFRLQDIVNPVNFGDHFFIDLFDDTRIPLWSVLLEHRFGTIGPLRDVAGSIVWVFDRYTSLGFGHSAQPWSIGFGRTLDAFAFGNDLFGQALFGHERNDVNMALHRNAAPAWNLKNSGIGMRWEATLGNFRLQLTDWFAFQDVAAFGWDRINVFDVPGCNEVLPAADPNNPMSVGGEGATVSFDGGANTIPMRINVKPKHIRMRDAGAVANVKGKYKRARYANLCGLGGSLSARYRKQNTLGLSVDWFEPNTGLVFRTEASWTANALVTDTTKSDLFADTNIYRWVLGIDRPTFIRFLNPTRSFFLSMQAFGTHLPDVNAGRFGNPNGAQDNFIFTFFVQNQYFRDQLVYLLFGAYGTTGVDGTLGGNAEYLLTNHWSVQIGVTAFLGTTREHDLTTFARFTTDGRPFSESGFGIGHMQAGGSERNQMNEFWGRIRYRF
jgi:hypothetical protein